eukprot:662950-Pleurochrysis_carterae.AAC.4
MATSNSTEGFSSPWMQSLSSHRASASELHPMREPSRGIDTLNASTASVAIGCERGCKSPCRWPTA